MGRPSTPRRGNWPGRRPAGPPGNWPAGTRPGAAQAGDGAAQACDGAAEAGDRFILSTGHYSIALWAAFAEAGLLPDAELEGYGDDGHPIAMSTIDGAVAGVELTGGSLGHGL